ncbi:MAG: (Fe-S)-binding protein [Candidatus Hydrothermarchaeales archaeon]
MKKLIEDLRDQVYSELERCIECEECTKACPLPESDEIYIKDLNRATASEDEPPRKLLEFAFDCFGCGACVPVCPEDLRRDLMMIWLRSRGKLPRGYNDLLHWRGQGLSISENVALSILRMLKRNVVKGLIKHVDNTDLKKSENLFYFGCYIFSPSRICHPTLRLADHLGMDYEVMAGYRYCCGYPHYSAGQLNRGEKLLSDLYRAIKKVSPKLVITGCAECYVALKMIKKQFDADFELITTSGWILRNLGKFDLSKTDEKVTFHDACMLSRLEGLSETPRRVIDQMAELVEISDNRENSLCCGGMRAKHNREGLLKIQVKKLEDAKKTKAKKMITECITCWEKYHPLAKEHGIEVVDIVEMVYNAM